MAEKKLSLIVDLINRTEGEFKNISKNFEELKKKTENTEKALKSIATAGAIGFGVIAAATYSTIKAASEAEVEMAKFNTTLKSMGPIGEKARDALLKTAAAAVKLGFDDEEAANSLAKLFQRTKSVTKAQTLLTLSMDLARAKGIGLTQSTNLINLALSGGGKALMQYGISIKDTASPMEALSILQEKVGGQAGAFAQTFAGSMAIMSTQTQNLKEAMGSALLPAISSLLQKIQPIVDKMVRWAEEHPALIRNVLLAGLAITGLITVLATLGLAFMGVTRFITGFTAANTLLGAGIKFLIATKITWAGTTLLVKNAVTAVTVATRVFAASLLTLRGALMATGIGAIIVLAGILIVKFQELADEVGGFGAAFKAVFLTIKIKFLEFLLTVMDGIGNVMDAIPGIESSFGDTITGLKIMIGEANGEFDILVAAANKPGQAADITADKINALATGVATDFGAMEESAGGASDAIKDRFDMMVEAVKNVRDEIKKTYQDIKAATDDYLKGVGQENKSYEQEVVETVAGAQKKKIDLEVELRSAQAKGSYDEIQRLGQQIQEQEAIIISYNSLQLDLNSRIDQEKQRLQMNELQRLTFDHQQKLTMMQTEFVEEQAKRLQRLVELQTEHQQILAMVSKDKAAKIEAEAAKGAAARDRLAGEKKGIKTWIDETTTMYTQYVSSVNSILGQIRSVPSASAFGSFSTASTLMSSFGVSGKRAAGGPVQPGRSFLVGEKGPELFTPSQYGQIQANGSMGGITIIVTGNSFMGKEGIADDIMKEVMKGLKNNVKL